MRDEKTLLKPDQNGVINIDPSVWNPPTTPAPIRLRPQDPPALSNVPEEIDQVGLKLESDLAEYERTKNGDPVADARQRELRMLLAEWEPKVKAARAELVEIEARPTPLAKLFADVAEAEQRTTCRRMLLSTACTNRLRN